MRERFPEIVERHQRAVYAVAFALTRDRALADDVAQEAFLVAWRRLDELRDPERLAAWLCGIARNVARDAIKRRRRETVADPADIADPATPFDALSDAQAEHAVANALATVPPVYREPLVMFYVEQRSIEDVAHALGLTTHTTNKRLSRGRARLAAQVDALVERRLTQRGPRPELVAGVLAAIAMLGSASHVDASPATAKGSIMPKLVLPAVLLAAAATVGGATLLSAGNATRSSTTSSAAPRAVAPAVAPVASASGNTASNSARPPTTSTTSHGSAPPPQLPTRAGVPDCNIVGRHVAELHLDSMPIAKRFSAEQRTQFLDVPTRAHAQQCVREQWTSDRRICVMAATEKDDVLACREDAIGTPADIAALPPELACEPLARHMADLVGGFTPLANSVAKSGQKLDHAAVSSEVTDQMRTNCESLPWSGSVRRCVAASKTALDAAQCL